MPYLQKYVLFQSVKCFFYLSFWKGQIHADVAGTVKFPAVLPANAAVPADSQDFVDGTSAFPAVAGAVQKEHVGRFGHGHVYVGETTVDVVTGVTAVVTEDLDQFSCPVLSLFGVGSDQGMHGEYVDLVVMEGV